MDVVLEDKIMKFHPDTVTTVRKLHNLEKPGDIDQLVDKLSDWLKLQNHLSKKEYSRDFLERSIITMKGSVERAKSQIDKLCSLRTLFPKFFEKIDAVNDYVGVSEVCSYVILPQLTQEHYRVAVLKVLGNGINKKNFFEALVYGILLCEYIKAHDYSDGVMIVLDYRDVNVIEFVSSVDLVDVHTFITIVTHGYGLRLKGIHTLTTSKAIKTILDTIKKMFSSKIANRFTVHDDVETLYQYLPKSILPAELGGEERSIVKLDAEWREHLGSRANIEYFREMRNAVSNEAYRLKETLNVTDFGLTGTFRSLNVD